jgi:HK97 family phage portal protein
MPAGLGALLTRSAPMPAPQTSVTPPTETMMAVGSAGHALPPPSETQALSVPAFWRGCAYVAGTVGMLPVSVFRDTEVLEPQPAVITQPDPDQTPMAFWAGVVESLALYGNAISLITSTDRYGWPQTLKPVHPTATAVRFAGNPMTPTIGVWYIAGQLYDPSDVWHIKSHLGRAGWPLGRGLLDTDSDAIAMAIALQGYAAGYFAGGGMPNGLLKIHRPEITQDQADAAKAAWVSKFSGAPSVAVLNELTDFTPVAWRPVDSQMVESRQFSLVEIALMWGIPPSKLGANVGGSTYRNAEMEEVQARNDAVAPWVRLLEQSGSIHLVPRGQHLEWDLSAALRSDTLSQYQAYQVAMGGPGPQSQWLLPDEVRSRENLDPMPEPPAPPMPALPPGPQPAPEPAALPRVPGGPPGGNPN